jgi:hypothetical protein
MLTCRWAARRLHRYLDADPSMPLGETEVRRLEEHLAQCEKCQGLEKDFRGLSALLRKLHTTSEPDGRVVARLHAQLSTITDGETV